VTDLLVADGEVVGVVTHWQRRWGLAVTERPLIAEGA
jgi:hypothetical protein